MATFFVVAILPVALVWAVSKVVFEREGLPVLGAGVTAGMIVGLTVGVAVYGVAVVVGLGNSRELMANMEFALNRAWMAGAAMGYLCFLLIVVTMADRDGPYHGKAAICVLVSLYPAVVAHRLGRFDLPMQLGWESMADAVVAGSTMGLLFGGVIGGVGAAFGVALPLIVIVLGGGQALLSSEHRDVALGEIGRALVLTPVKFAYGTLVGSLGGLALGLWLGAASGLGLGDAVLEILGRPGPIRFAMILTWGAGVGLVVGHSYEPFEDGG